MKSHDQVYRADDWTHLDQLKHHLHHFLSECGKMRESPTRKEAQKMKHARSTHDQSMDHVEIFDDMRQEPIDHDQDIRERCCWVWKKGVPEFFFVFFLQDKGRKETGERRRAAGVSVRCFEV